MGALRVCQGIAWLQAVTGGECFGTGAGVMTGACMADVIAEESKWDKISYKLKTDAPVIAIRTSEAITPFFKTQGLR